MATPIPKTPTEVLVRIFGNDPVAEILAQDSKKPFERDEQILFNPTFTGRLTHQTFGGMGGIFRLFSDPTEVALRVWFKITEEVKVRAVTLEKAELSFSKPYWGGEDFYYCQDSKLPAKYSIKKTQDSSCTEVRKLELKRITIEEDSENRPDVDADIVISASPRFLPSLNNFSINGRDIDKIIYGAFHYAGISDWVEGHRRHNDVTAVLAGFFEAFLPGRTPAAR